MEPTSEKSILPANAVDGVCNVCRGSLTSLTCYYFACAKQNSNCSIVGLLLVTLIPLLCFDTDTLFFDSVFREIKIKVARKEFF